ncbi:MAG: TlpA family protein disulfide reductase [Bernardetiaceae bacterium]|nr:TlpA family protein disulfide reductase [Bernardetiaceae bacterium]
MKILIFCLNTYKNCKLALYRNYASLLLCMSLLLVFVLGACAEEKGLPRGSEAPDFEVQTLEGKTVKLSDYKGKVVMLYFWADWCPACKKEFPDTQAYYEKLKSDDFEILVINVKQEKKISQEFQEKFEATFPMIADTDGSLSSLYKVDELLPTNYFIDTEGKVIRQILGWIDEQQVRVMINQYRK